jgi:hypothetical protein
MGRATPAPDSFVSEWWLSACAGSHRFKAFGMEDNMLCLSNMNRSEVRLGVGAYHNNEWRLFKIRRWIEYVCVVKSETIKLDHIVPLRCACTSLLSKEMLGSTLWVSLEYASCVSGYDISPRYRLDSPCIPGWLGIRSLICLEQEVDSNSHVQLTQNQSI